MRECLVRNMQASICGRMAGQNSLASIHPLNSLTYMPTYLVAFTAFSDAIFSYYILYLTMGAPFASRA